MKDGERTSDSSFFVHSMSVTKDFYLVQEIFRLLDRKEIGQLLLVNFSRVWLEYKRFFF